MGVPVQGRPRCFTVSARLLPSGLRAFDDRTSYASPERRLMLATIVEAIRDALGNSAITTPGTRDKARREALAWFREAGADFESVCHLAGLDPESTRRAALTYVASGKPVAAVRRGNRRTPIEQKEAA